jgi:hypothetical protein
VAPLTKGCRSRRAPICSAHAVRRPPGSGSPSWQSPSIPPRSAAHGALVRGWWAQDPKPGPAGRDQRVLARGTRGRPGPVRRHRACGQGGRAPGGAWPGGLLRQDSYLMIGGNKPARGRQSGHGTAGHSGLIPHMQWHRTARAEAGARASTPAVAGGAGARATFLASRPTPRTWPPPLSRNRARSGARGYQSCRPSSGSATRTLPSLASEGARTRSSRSPRNAAVRAVGQNPARRRPAGLVGVVHPRTSRLPRQGHLARPARRCRRLRAGSGCARDQGLSGGQPGREGRRHDGLRGHPPALRGGRLHQSCGHRLGHGPWTGWYHPSPALASSRLPCLFSC